MTSTNSDMPDRLARAGQPSLAYHYHEGDDQDGAAPLPTVVFLPGYRSDMQGSKALRLEAHCRDQGQSFLRLDYSGHGQSDGEFTDGTIGQWAGDAMAVIDAVTSGPLILVGSSMGGWIMLLIARARQARVVGLVGIAAAPDFTEDLMMARATPEMKAALARDGVYHQPSEYSDVPTPITARLIDEARAHQQLKSPLPLTCPVRLLQGMQDPDVPWQTALRLTEVLQADDVEVTLIKRGDHRLSEDQYLRRLCQTVSQLTAECIASS